MTPKIVKISLLLLLLSLIAMIVPVCGCGNQKSTQTSTSNSTCPTTVPRASSTQPQITAPSISTDTSPSQALLEQAKAEDKPVLIKFGSGQCVPCIQIEENINKVRPEYEGKVAFIIVDVYDQRENNLTAQYGIETIPTTFFLGKDGGIVNNQVGVMTPEQLKQQLDALL